MRHLKLVDIYVVGKQTGVGAEQAVDDGLASLAALMKTVEVFFAQDETHTRLELWVCAVVDIAGVMKQMECTVGLNGKLTECLAEFLHAELKRAVFTFIDTHLKKIADVVVGVFDIVNVRIGLGYPAA